MIEEGNNTLWCGNISEQVSEELLYELFLQAGPLQNVSIPRDRDGRKKPFAFITFSHEVSVPYAIQLFRGTALFNKSLQLQARGGRMPLLPPPIRCYGPEPPINFNCHPQITEQFSDMARRLPEQDLRMIALTRHNMDPNEKLILASLQGNWSHRSHPYRGKGKDKGHSRDDFRPRESHRDQKNKHNSPNWQHRRNRRGNYHRD